MRNSEVKIIDPGLKDLGFSPTAHVEAHWGVVHSGGGGRIPVLVPPGALYESKDEGPLDDMDVSLDYLFIRTGTLYKRADKDGKAFTHGIGGAFGDNVKHGLLFKFREIKRTMEQRIRRLPELGRKLKQRIRDL